MDAAIEPLVARVRRALGPISGVRVAYLFGSQVTGRARRDSDLDVAVLYDPSLDAEGREEARRDVVAALVRELGPLGETGDVVDLDRVGSGVGFRAVRDGRLLLERERAERVRLVARIARAYDDDAPRRELMRRAAIEAGRRLGAETAGRS